jgi:HK97 family phage portal protein
MGKKQVTDNKKIINAEVGIVKTDFVMPRFNRRIAVNSYTGYWAAAIDINAQAAASGTMHLHSKIRNNRGQKCLYSTVKHPDPRQRDYMKGILQDKPSSSIQMKQVSSLENYEIVQGHPVSDLLISANPMQSTYQLYLDIFLALEITGDCFLFVVSNTDGTPAQLYVLQSQFMDIIPARVGGDKLVSHYEYNRGKGLITRFEEDEIIHIKYPNPSSIWYGMGKIEKGWQSFLLNKFSHEYAIALYANHAVPSYLLVNKSGQSVSKKRWFKNMVNGNRGPTRAGKVLAADADISIETLAFKPADMQETKLTTTEIAAISGCPLNLLIGSDAVKANGIEQNVSHLRNTVHPMMKIVASTLSEQLLWRYGIEQADAFLAFDNPVPSDMAHQLKSDEVYSKTGILTPNEIRIGLGKEPVGEEGDVLYFNGSELGKTPDPVANPFEMANENTEDEDEAKKMAVVMGELDSIIKSIETDEKKEPVPAPPPFTINISNESLVEEVIENTKEDI